MNVAIVSSLEYCNKISEDIALADALREIGVDCKIVAWNDSDVEWGKFDTAILRSAWGYYKYYSNFLKWLGILDAKQVPLINDTNMVRWNTQKDKQFGTLNTFGIPIIPYVVSENLSGLDSIAKMLNSRQIVIKPVVSASGNDTHLINMDLITERQLCQISNKFNNRKCLVQPFIKDITSGEYALVYLGGKLSHAVIRFPGVFAEKKSPIYMMNQDIPKNIIKLADNTSSSITKFFGHIPAYARYDIVNDMLMETELAEPDLMTRNIPEELKKSALRKLAGLVFKKGK